MPKDYTAEIFGGCELAPRMECAFKPINEVVQFSDAEIAAMMESSDPELYNLIENMNVLTEAEINQFNRVHDKSELDQVFKKVQSIKDPVRYVNLIMRTIIFTLKVIPVATAINSVKNQQWQYGYFMKVLNTLGLGALGYMIFNQGAQAIEWFIVKLINHFSENTYVTSAEKISAIKDAIKRIDEANDKASTTGNAEFSKALVETKRKLEAEIEKVKANRSFL